MINKDYINSIIMQLKERNEYMKESVKNRENIYRNSNDNSSKRSQRREIDILNATISANRYVIEELEKNKEITVEGIAEKIKEKLIELGFNVNSKGFMYWLEAIQYARKNVSKYRIGDIYNNLAKKHNETYIKVERAMRFSRERANDNIQKEFNISKKVSNNGFLNLMELLDFEEETWK